MMIGACSGSQASRGPSPAARGEVREDGRVGASRPRGAALRAACRLPFDQLRRLRRGYYPGRSPEVVAVPRAPSYFGGFSVYTHSGPWDYVQRVPLVLYGPGFVKRRGEVSVHRDATVADLAPTFAELLGMRWPHGRAGTPLHEALVPERNRREPPKLLVTVVWDGGGWDVLHQWPKAWPNLRRLMERGTSVAGVEVGSSPSVTPAVHATIGTGEFPDRHGIVDIPLRRGNAIVGSWPDKSPKYLEVRTLGDLYDTSMSNRPKVAMIAENNWHLGMLGHGAFIEDGDKDVAVMIDNDGALVTNRAYYSLPSYLPRVPGFADDVRFVDLSDGRLDARWRAHELLDDPTEIRHTPVWALYLTRLLKELIRRDGLGADAVPDLLYTNYKQIDLIGHDWNMLSPEVADIVRYSDDALGGLVAYLNRVVGRGQWVLAVTADHGQAPKPLSVGAWPIATQELKADVARRFGVDAEELFQDERPGALWLDRQTMSANGISERAVSELILRYTLADNVVDGRSVPDAYADRLSERLFSAAFPYRWMPRLWSRCGASRSSGG